MSIVKVALVFKGDLNKNDKDSIVRSIKNHFSKRTSLNSIIASSLEEDEQSIRNESLQKFAISMSKKSLKSYLKLNGE